MNDLKKIEPLNVEQRRLQSKAGYFAAYEHIAATTATKREAYEILEEQYERVFGRRKYAEYPNFCRYRLEFYARRK